MLRRQKILMLTTAALALACLIPAAQAEADANQRRGPSGAAYTMTNDPAGNSVLAYARTAGGRLRFAHAYPTEGLGSGEGLGSQGAVVLSEDGRWLFAVNAGSDEISVFAVRRGGLKWTDTTPSGGIGPVSLAVSGDLVYVVHAGSDDVAGFRLGHGGHLAPLSGSVQPLSGAGAGPAQIAFSPNGRFLLVSEKATNNISVFPVDQHGIAGAAVVNASEGMTPFAFGFGKRGRVFVTEVFGGAEDAGAVSSYELLADGTLEVVDASVENTETAPCWLVVSPGARYLFTTNTPDDSLSAYAVDFDGHLSLVDADGRTGEPGEGTRPLDMDLSDNGRFLFTLNIGNGTISTFSVAPDGSLEQLGMVDGVPAGVVGLAAR